MTFSAGSTFAVELNGTAAGHDQLSVTGTVNLGGATLATSGTYAPTTSDSFLIVDNDGTADAVVGTRRV